MMYAYKNQNNVDVRVARIFNTFGPRMHPNDGRVVSNFIIQSLQNKDITIYGDGSITRSFQYVDDLVNGLVKLMNGNYDQPVNIGNPDEITIGEFAQEILDLTGATVEVVARALPENDPKQRRPDIGRAKEVLGWTPKVSRAEGLQLTYAYFKGLSEEDLHRSEHKDFESFTTR